VRQPLRLLAAGRDAEIFEYGPHLVLRRSRHGRSMAGEARIMEYVRTHGYPVPAVEEVSDDGCDLVMERVAGRSLVDTMTRAPWRLRHYGGVLADLHRRLHDIDAPAFLTPAPVGTGSSVVHLDLHPLNVIMSPAGPVVIDWSNAARGDPRVDVALAWALIAGARIPGRLIPALLGWTRTMAVEGFLAPFDRPAIVAVLSDVVQWKATDPNMAPDEIEGMWRVVGDAEKTERRARHR
jgi:aminoglycoside phosphotransferase (APT) family kinase protein